MSHPCYIFCLTKKKFLPFIKLLLDQRGLAVSAERSAVIVNDAELSTSTTPASRRKVDSLNFCLEFVFALHAFTEISSIPIAAGLTAFWMSSAG